LGVISGVEFKVLPVQKRAPVKALVSRRTRLEREAQTPGQRITVQYTFEDAARRLHRTTARRGGETAGARAGCFCAVCRRAIERIIDLYSRPSPR